MARLDEVDHFEMNRVRAVDLKGLTTLMTGDQAEIERTIAASEVQTGFNAGHFLIFVHGEKLLLRFFGNGGGFELEESNV